MMAETLRDQIGINKRSIMAEPYPSRLSNRAISLKVMELQAETSSGDSFKRGTRRYIGEPDNPLEYDIEFEEVSMHTTFAIYFHLIRVRAISG